MSELGDLDTYKYLLVEFRDDSSELTQIECVPKDRVDYDENHLIVYYPPPPYVDKKCKKIREMIQEVQDSDVEWDNHKVNLKGRAKTHREALKKLDLLQKKSNVLTIDDEGQSKFFSAAIIEKIKRDKPTKKVYLFDKSNLLNFDDDDDMDANSSQDYRYSDFSSSSSSSSAAIATKTKKQTKQQGKPNEKAVSSKIKNRGEKGIAGKGITKKSAFEKVAGQPKESQVQRTPISKDPNFKSEAKMQNSCEEITKKVELKNCSKYNVCCENDILLNSMTKPTQQKLVTRDDIKKDIATLYMPARTFQVNDSTAERIATYLLPRFEQIVQIHNKQLELKLTAINTKLDSICLEQETRKFEVVNATSFENKYNIKLPIGTIFEYDELDEKLLEKAVAKDLEDSMLSLFDKNIFLTRNISSIMKAYLKKMLLQVSLP